MWSVSAKSPVISTKSAHVRQKLQCSRTHCVGDGAPEVPRRMTMHPSGCLRTVCAPSMPCLSKGARPRRAMPFRGPVPPQSRVKSDEADTYMYTRSDAKARTRKNEPRPFGASFDARVRAACMTTPPSTPHQNAPPIVGQFDQIWTMIDQCRGCTTRLGVFRPNQAWFQPNSLAPFRPNWGLIWTPVAPITMRNSPLPLCRCGVVKSKRLCACVPE